MLKMSPRCQIYDFFKMFFFFLLLNLVYLVDELRNKGISTQTHHEIVIFCSLRATVVVEIPSKPDTHTYV